MPWRERFAIFFDSFTEGAEKYGFDRVSRTRRRLIKRFEGGQAGLFIQPRITRPAYLSIAVFAQMRYPCIEDMLHSTGFIELQRGVECWMLGGNIGNLEGRGYIEFRTSEDDLPLLSLDHAADALKIYEHGGLQLHQNYQSLASIYPLTETRNLEARYGFNSSVQRWLIRLYLTKRMRPEMFGEECMEARKFFVHPARQWEREYFLGCLHRLR